MTNRNQSKEVVSPVPRTIIWPTIVFASACIAFLFTTYFYEPDSEGKRKLLNGIFALTAGLSTIFIGGTALLKLQGQVGRLKGVFTGTSGVAVFIFCLWYPLYGSEVRDSHGHIIPP